jgi:hypothetical protein
VGSSPAKCSKIKYMQIIHGLAKAKEDMDNIQIKKNDLGFITAYLPEMEKFAVMFPGEKWITFTMNEEEFLERFEVEKEE